MRANALAYLATHRRFTFSIVTRYEILRGLVAKQATRQIKAFNARCALSNVVPLTDPIVVVAADIYGNLRRRGQLISDADILIAATTLVHNFELATENVAHFSRITGLTLRSWRAP